MKSIVVYPAIARLGNTCFQFAAAYSYALDHNLDFSPPSQTLDEKWRALYFKHLINPNIESPNLKRIEIKEHGYRYQPLEFRPEWAEDHLIVIGGFRQSPLYFDHHRERVLQAFGFPWELRPGWCAVHLRRGDYLIHVHKHPPVEPEWYLSQMNKIVHLKHPESVKFLFLSDDIDYCRATFGYLGNAYFASKFESPEWFREITEQKPEVRDLIAGSQCEHVIGSASTFAVWMGLLGRNPDRRVIIPREWIKNGWQGTTADDWKDVVPTGPGWERA